MEFFILNGVKCIYLLSLGMSIESAHNIKLLNEKQKIF